MTNRGDEVKRVRTSGMGAVAGTVCAALLLVAFATSAKAQTAAPGKPTNVSVTGGNRRVEVSWKAPASEGGSPITGYEVTPYRGTTKQPSITLDTPDTSTTVTGLANNARYTFRVAAINASGTGPLSDASATVTPKGPGTKVWYEQKRWWAAGLVVLVALIVIGVFAFRRSKRAAPKTVAEPSSSTPGPGED